MSIEKKYKVPRTAITERGLKRLLKEAFKGTSRAQWAEDKEITPQSISAFLNETQTAGLKIPEALGYRPQIVYLPLDEELICHQNPPRREASRPSAKVDHSKRPVEKRGKGFDDRKETRDRLRAKKKK